MMITAIARLGRRPSALLTHRRHCMTSARLGTNALSNGGCAAASHPHHEVTARYAVAVVPPYRSIHSTSFILKDGWMDDSGGASIIPDLRTKHNANHGHDNRRHDKKRPATTSKANNFPEASSTIMTPDEEPEEYLMDDDGNIPSLGANNDATIGYDFGEEGGNELEKWHSDKEDQFQVLSSKTEEILANIVDKESDIRAILSLMQEWNSFLSSVNSELHSSHEFRRQNQQYPPSEYMRSLTYESAQMTENILAHLLGGAAPLSPETEVNAYKLAMASWPHVFHPQSGDRCEKILEQYGERFGGDMNYMPMVDSYKTVQEAHMKSCSSYMMPSNLKVEGGSTPGDKALGVLTLLTNVHTAGDMFLKPDVELYSHTIATVRNTLLDWQCRRRFQSTDDDATHDMLVEKNLAMGLLDALDRMESLLDEKAKGKKKSEGIQLSFNEWRCAIRAYADGLATVARIAAPFLNRESSAEKLLTKLEKLITNYSSNIVHSIGEAGLNDTDFKHCLEDTQRNVEESYTSALSSGLILSKEAGALVDFNSALKNATSSEDIFQRMRLRSQESPPDMDFLFPTPTPESYHALIECWCECLRKGYSNDDSNAAIVNLEELPHLKAESLLKQLEIQQSSRPIDGATYLTVIWAWSQVLNWPGIYRTNNDNFFAIKAIDKFLKKTMRKYDNGSVHFAWKGTVTKMYNFVFRLNSKIFKGGEGGMKRSLKLLDEMEFWYSQSEGTIAQPDTFTFGLILKTISNSGVQSASSHAENILQRMESFGVKPRERHYLSVIRSYSRIGQMDVSDPMKAEAVLQQVKERYAENKSVKPNNALYTSCISAYGGSKQHNSVSKVLELFEEVNELYKETNDEEFQPDSMLYGAVVSALSKAKSNDATSIKRAMQFLDRMEQSYDMGHIETGPNRYVYTNLLHSLSRSRIADRSSMAEGLMHRMDRRSVESEDESIRPDTHAYTTLMQIFAYSRQPDSVDRAQKWFKQMQKRFEDGDARSKPNKVTYTALINCWRSSDRAEAGEEAETILSTMESKYEKGHLELKPDSYVYAGAVDAWASSQSHDKAVRAWSIYKRMKEQYADGNMDAKPNEVIITSVIKACGYTRGSKEDKQKALMILLECMAEMKSTKYLSPTSITYRSLLNAARALVADDARRHPISQTIFETCCRNGQLDTTVLEALQKVQPELYVKLPTDIPSKWKRNISQGRPGYR